MTLLPILLPDGFTSKVSAGDKIAAGSVIAEGEHEHQEEVIHVAHELKLIPKKIAKYLKKNIGDSVTVGDILAVKKSLFGSQEIISNFSGTIAKLDEETGDLVIRVGKGESLQKTILSPVDGIVDSVNNQKVIIKSDKHAFLALDGIGNEKEGELLYIPGFNEDKLDAKVDGKIILAEEIGKIALFKAISLGVAGLITKKLEGIDFINLQEKNITEPVLEVSDEDFERLEKCSGNKAYLFGKNKSIIVL